METYSIDNLPKKKPPLPVFYTAQSNESLSIVVSSHARIAIYDDNLIAPRIIDVAPLPIREYIEKIASVTYSSAKEQGGSLPFAAIREVAENFIHAGFKEPVVSILNKGNTITFADQGPGIEEKEKAVLPGYTSATSEMKDYILGVGSGLPLVSGYLSVTGGYLKIEDNVREGTVVTLSLYPEDIKEEKDDLVVSPHQKRASVGSLSPAQKKITERETSIMLLFLEYDAIGQSDIKRLLGIPLATASRTLESLELVGLLTTNSMKKRVLTDAGFDYLKTVSTHK